MQLGMIGLGRMGANIVRRLMRGGHECVAYDVNQDSIRQLESEGAIGATSLEDFVGKLSRPRAAWSRCSTPSPPVSRPPSGPSGGTGSPPRQKRAISIAAPTGPATS